MKLLSQPQGKSKQELETANTQRHAIDLDALIAKKRKELDDLDRSFITTLSTIGAKNYEEEARWKEKISALEREVDALESRRKAALVPLQERENEADNRERALARREEAAQIKESDLEYTKQRLEDRLDDVAEREQSVVDSSIRLNTREFTIQAKEKDIEDKTNALTIALKQSYQEIVDEKKLLDQQKAVLKGRDVAIREREEQVALKEAGFAAREEAILDKYRTLQRTINEVKLKPNDLQRHP